MASVLPLQRKAPWWATLVLLRPAGEGGAGEPNGRRNRKRAQEETVPASVSETTNVSTPIATIMITISISGLVVEYIVAIDVTRVRFPADALLRLRSHVMWCFVKCKHEVSAAAPQHAADTSVSEAPMV